MADPFIGQIMIVPYNFAPRNWAFCDGQLLSIAQNTALFSLLGTTYGGDGRTVFGLPDLRGRVPIHQGRGPGLAERRIGSKGGAETGTLSTAQVPAHGHDISTPLKATKEKASEKDPAGNLLAKQKGNKNIYSDSVAAPVDMAPEISGNTASAGGGQSHNNMQPFLGLNIVIALQGIYPSRS